jgi:Phage integrase family
LVAATYRTLIGLLAVTGMRLGEAINLDRDDVDLDEGVLVVRQGKFGKSRELVLHPSTVTARRLQVVAITDAGYLAQIHEAARLAQSAKSPNVVVEHVRRQLVDLLDLRGCRFEFGTLMGHPPRLDPDGSVVRGRRRWSADQAGLPHEEVELRAVHGGRFYGRFMLQATPGAVSSPQARLVAVTLADQAGAAFQSGAAKHRRLQSMTRAA